MTPQRSTVATGSAAKESGMKHRIVNHIGAAITHADDRELLLEALKRGNRYPDFSCTKGFCGTCKTKLLTGRIEPLKSTTTSRKLADRGYILPCVSIVKSDLVLDFSD